MNGSGRISLRNRKFLKIDNTVKPTQMPSIIPTPALAPADKSFYTLASNQPVVHTRIPRALKQLQNFNNPGLKE